MVWTVSNSKLHPVSLPPVRHVNGMLNAFRALSRGKAAGGLRVYVTGDGADVYEDTFMKLAKEDRKTFQPVLILVGIRLGIDRVTPVYWDALKMSLQLSQSIGIAGSVHVF